MGEVLVEWGARSVGETFRRRSRAHPVLAGIGVIILGALAGLVSSLLLPTRIFGAFPVRGISLFVSPLITGVLMDQYGQWRERRGGQRSFVATFWGGALFAFSMALVRFLWITA